jgi:hypothetical protein
MPTVSETPKLACKCPYVMGPTGPVHLQTCKEYKAPPAPKPTPPPVPMVPPGAQDVPVSYVVTTGPMKVEKSVKIGLPAFSSAYASVQDWAREGESPEQLAERLTDRLEREIMSSVQVAFRVHERIAKGGVTA